MQQWPRQLYCDSSRLEMVGCLAETSLWFPSGFFQWLIVWPVIPSSHPPVEEIIKQIRPSLGQSNHSVGWSERAMITQTLPLRFFFYPELSSSSGGCLKRRCIKRHPDLWFRCLRRPGSRCIFSSFTGDGIPNEPWEKQFPWSGGTESRPAFGCEPKTTVVRGRECTLGESGPSRGDPSAAVIGQQNSREF